MYNSEEKAQITQMVIGRTFRRVVPEQARVVMFGGLGIEAAAWRATGVQESNTWIIERSPRRCAKLLEDYPNAHLLQGDIRKFLQVFEATHGTEEGIDHFHWDLNGTVEPRTEQLNGIVPLLLRGGVRSLAVTMADQRRNLGLERPDETKRAAVLAFPGSTVFQLWGHLLHEHHEWNKRFPAVADPYNIALRELSALTCLFQMLNKHGKSVSIENVLRITYVSHGFRMRAYHFFLTPCKLSGTKLAAHFVNAIITSPCNWAGDGITPYNVTVPPVAEVTKESEMVQDAQTNNRPASHDLSVDAARAIIAEQLPALKMLIPPLGAAVEALLAYQPPSSVSLDDVERVVQAAINGLRSPQVDDSPKPAPVVAEKTEKKAEKKTPPVRAKASAAARTKPAPARGKRLPEARPFSKRKRSASDREITVEDGDAIRFKLLEAKLQGAGIYTAEYNKLMGEAKLSKRSFQAVWANGQGGLAPQFWARQIQLRPLGSGERQSMIQRLARLSGITPEALLERAQASRNWRSETAPTG